VPAALGFLGLLLPTLHGLQAVLRLLFVPTLAELLALLVATLAEL
jgi:hypothetical protein